jgi:hypothetical protein
MIIQIKQEIKVNVLASNHCLEIVSLILGELSAIKKEEELRVNFLSI